MKEAPVHDERIEVRVEAEAIPLSVDTAVFLGMVVNELTLAPITF